MINSSRLYQLKSRFTELEILISEERNSEKMIELSKEYADLRSVVSFIDDYEAVVQELADLEDMANDSETEEELREWLASEVINSKEVLLEKEKALKLALLPKGMADHKNAIVEIRAGTGGDEAALFVSDLLRMYLRFAEFMAWKAEILDQSQTDLNGLKEVIIHVSGQNVFSYFKYESGGHRVQRIPQTEVNGRVHTSTATVAVLPEAEEVDIEVEDKDLRIDTYRSQGAGGQHVNTTDSAVRITHLPTGTVTQCQDEKSQHKNRVKAMTMLRSKLFEQERLRIESSRAAERKDKVGSGSRSDRIRTYNFPQNRISDHRINLTQYNLDKLIAGEALGELINALITDDQLARLAMFNS